MHQTRFAEILNDIFIHFRTVRQSLFYLGVTATNADRLAALRQESDMKRQGGVSSFASPIGFHP